MRAKIQDGLVVQIGDNPVRHDNVEVDPAFAAIDLNRLRYDGEKVIDLANYDGPVFVDARGLVFPNDAPGRTEVADWSWGDELVQDDDGWRLETEADVFQATKAETLAAAMVKAEQYVAPFTAGYSETERLSWDAQESEAKAVIDGSLAPSDAELLMGIAGSHQGVTALAPKIAAKASLFRNVVAALIRIRKATNEAISSAKNPAELDAAVEALTAEAEAAQAQLLAAASGN